MEPVCKSEVFADGRLLFTGKVQVGASPFACLLLTSVHYLVANLMLHKRLLFNVFILVRKTLSSLFLLGDLHAFNKTQLLVSWRSSPFGFESSSNFKIDPDI